MVLEPTAGFKGAQNVAVELFPVFDTAEQAANVNVVKRVIGISPFILGIIQLKPAVGRHP